MSSRCVEGRRGFEVMMVILEIMLTADTMLWILDGLC